MVFESNLPVYDDSEITGRLRSFENTTVKHLCELNGMFPSGKCDKFAFRPHHSVNVFRIGCMWMQAVRFSTLIIIRYFLFKLACHVARMFVCVEKFSPISNVIVLINHKRNTRRHRNGRVVSKSCKKILLEIVWRIVKNNMMGFRSTNILNFEIVFYHL
jgi:hypothetical protein